MNVVSKAELLPDRIQESFRALARMPVQKTGNRSILLGAERGYPYDGRCRPGGDALHNWNCRRPYRKSRSCRYPKVTCLVRGQRICRRQYNAETVSDSLLRHDGELSSNQVRSQGKQESRESIRWTWEDGALPRLHASQPKPQSRQPVTKEWRNLWREGPADAERHQGREDQCNPKCCGDVNKAGGVERRHDFERCAAGKSLS